MVEMIQKYLKDEIELEYGKGLTRNQRRNGKIPVYGSNGIVDYNDKFYFEGPGIIIGRKGTVGSLKYEENNFWAIDTTYVVKLKNKNEDLIFWYYFLQTLGLERMNSHSAVPGLNRDRVYNIKINIPKKQEDRKRISIILGDLDKKIELNNQINDNLFELSFWDRDFCIKARTRCAVQSVPQRMPPSRHRVPESPHNCSPYLR